MREWSGQDPTEVRAADLASAAAVVVRFRRKRRATVAAALCVGVATLVSSRAFFAVTTSSLVPTEQPPATAPAVGVQPSPTPTVPPADAATATRPPGVPGTGSGSGPVAAAPAADPDDPADQPRRNRRFRIGMVRELGGSMTTTQCGLNPLPSQAQVCVGPRASQQKNGSVVLTYTACLRQPTLSTADVRFPTTREVDFAIVKDGRIVWQWSTGQRFVTRDHTVTIPADSCVTWRTRWTGHLDDGTRVPSGKYTLRASGKDATKLLPRRLVTFDVTF